ncbi:eCIS core domain-containing protein [Pseudocnuella soli]|uniref:eCIS core domain-containing protein n=1 Tax=Pseudocnuella soli TaxID=2502779 RepID=UPI001049E57C
MQRKCEKCEEEGKHVNRLPEQQKDEEKKLQKQEPSSATNANYSNVASNYIHSLGNAGQPLPHQEQAFFGQSINHDFSNVKIHTGIEAATLARNINAKAYTIDDIVLTKNNNNQPRKKEKSYWLTNWPM